MYLVTANHVLRKWGDYLLCSPLNPGWKLERLDKYKWKQISDGISQGGDDGAYDLAYVALTSTEAGEINPLLVQPIARATDLNFPFTAVAHGYRAKNNHSLKIKLRGWARPDFYEANCNGVYRELTPPYVKPYYTGTMDLQFNRKIAAFWNGQSYCKTGMTAPKPAGLSGGPIFHCKQGSKQASSTSAREPIVGFLVSHSDETGIAKAVISDVLLSCVYD